MYYISQTKMKVDGIRNFVELPKIGAPLFEHSNSRSLLVEKNLEAHSRECSFNVELRHSLKHNAMLEQDLSEVI